MNRLKSVFKSIIVIYILLSQFDGNGQMLQFDQVSGLSYIKREGKTTANTIVLLHGYRSNEQDLFSFAKYFPETTFICLRATNTHSKNAFTWYDIDFSNGVKTKNMNQVDESASKLYAYLETLNRSQGQKIIIGGFSQGAIMSLKTVIEKPDLIDGAICFSGAPLVNNYKAQMALIKEYKNLEVFYGHGIHDDVLPIEKGRACKKILENAGISTTYKEYGMKHQIVAEELQDLMSWYQAHFSN